MEQTHKKTGNNFQCLTPKQCTLINYYDYRSLPQFSQSINFESYQIKNQSDLEKIHPMTSREAPQTLFTKMYFSQFRQQIIQNRSIENKERIQKPTQQQKNILDLNSNINYQQETKSLNFHELNHQKQIKIIQNMNNKRQKRKNYLYSSEYDNQEIIIMNKQKKKSKETIDTQKENQTQQNPKIPNSNNELIDSILLKYKSFNPCRRRFLINFDADQQEKQKQSIQVANYPTNQLQQQFNDENCNSLQLSIQSNNLLPQTQKYFLNKKQLAQNIKQLVQEKKNDIPIQIQIQNQDEKRHQSLQKTNTEQKSPKKIIDTQQEMPIVVEEIITEKKISKFQFILPKLKLFQQFQNTNKDAINEKLQMKIANFEDFIFKINFSNNIIIQQPKCHPQYKVKIKLGNNFQIIREAFKNRWWWHINFDQEVANSIWTPSKKQKIIDSIPISQNSESKRYCQFESYQNNNHQQLSQIFNPIDLKQHLNLINNTNFVKKIQNNYKSINKQLKIDDNSVPKIQYNHIDGYHHFCNKKLLFMNLKFYFKLIEKDVYQIIPLTFHITNNVDIQNDPEYKNFKKHYEKTNEWEDIKNIYIIKPGEDTNRGRGIQVSTELWEIDYLIKKQQTHKDGTQYTYLIQQYMHKPLLYNKRKFDIRSYMLITCVNGLFKGYFYEEGYLRTSSYPFNLQNLQNQMVHLTNDAIQKNAENYGKFENGNKVSINYQISYNDFQKYLQQFEKDLYRDFIPIFKKISKMIINSVFTKLVKKDFTFEVKFKTQIYGLDFMIDDQFNVFLIECNTNPCLETPCILLTRLMSSLIENSIRQNFKLELQWTLSSHLPMHPDGAQINLLFFLTT